MIIVLVLSGASAVIAQDGEVEHLVQVGDSWIALGQRYGVDPVQLQAASGHINSQREPAIGSVVMVPQTAVFSGNLIRSADGGLLQTAVSNNTTAWQIALQNEMPSPYRPQFYQPVFIEEEGRVPRDLPMGFETLELSAIPAHPGEGVGYRGQTTAPVTVTAELTMRGGRTDLLMDVMKNGRFQTGTTGTGAFFGSGEPALNIQVETNGRLLPLWTQPWAFEDKSWAYQELYFTGSAGAITQEMIDAEREQMFALWELNTPLGWETTFQRPIDNYFELSSNYGTRRSNNGGPYSTYHEGVDYSAYRGTPVMAAAAGTVVLAETLPVRGGTVIIDHGAGVYTGMYHLSAVETAVSTTVQTGDIVGLVGTTGLSTGNHLHWDLIVNTVWVDGEAWLAQDMGCWLAEGLGQSCD